MNTIDIFILYTASTLLFWTLLLTPQLIKNTRQKLFNIRDTAFLDLKHNKEYYHFREVLNTLIRFTHNISWQRMLFDFIVLRKEIKQQQGIKSEFNDDELNKLFLESALLVIRLMYLRSPVLILISTPLVLIAVIKIEILPKIKKQLSIFVMNDASIYTHR